jgi:hypothetical protein
MESQDLLVTPMNTIPADIVEMLGPPPLLSTEDEKLYFAIMAKIARPLPSPDILTWMLIKDLADHRFEIARYRRIKSRLIQQAAEQAEQESLRRLAPDPDGPIKGPPLERAMAAFDVELRAIRGDAEAQSARGNESKFNELIDQQVRERRARDAKALGAKLEPDPPMKNDYAAVFANWINDVEKIDVPLRAAEQRFSQGLREIERHIIGFGRLLRDDLDKLIDGEVVSRARSHQEVRAVSQPAPKLLRQDQKPGASLELLAPRQRGSTTRPKQSGARAMPEVHQPGDARAVSGQDR